MKVLITGLTGLIGRTLGKALKEKGHDILGLSRSPNRAKKELSFDAQFFPWDLYEGEVPLEAIEQADAIIHLAGHPIAEQRWTQAVQKKILDSRVLGTRHIVQSISSSSKKPKIFISASAIGYYPYSDHEQFDENSKSGDHFLAEVCRKWEKEAREVNSVSTQIRSVQIRIGVVLAPDGGALEKMLPLAKSGVLGPIGDGRQMMSWIHIDDLVGIFVKALEDDNYKSVINGVSPHPVSNRDLTQQLMKALGKRSFLPVPRVALKLAFGKMSEVLIQGQKVVPKKLNELEFRFLYPDIESAMKNIIENQGGKP